MKKEDTFKRIKERMNKLCSDFTYYLTKSEQFNQFTGPSLHFHLKTLERLRKHKPISTVFDDDIFFEYLYATLTAWGLHRMGPREGRLGEFKDFIQSIRKQKNAIEELEPKNLLTLPKEDVKSIADLLWEILNNIQVRDSKSKTKLVANTKALHHILPKLIPPIDRRHTLRFFYDRETIDTHREKYIFCEIFHYFHEIGSRNRMQINSHIGHGFHTSETKVIDNAVIEFVRLHKYFQKKGE